MELTLQLVVKVRQFDSHCRESNQAVSRCPRGTYCWILTTSERFGTRLETFFIALCVALGDIDGKPFSVAKIASYVRVPRTTVIRRHRGGRTTPCSG